jgi:predicted secreted Zn-dependent protease
MRAVTVAALVLAAACGSSSSEVAPPPAPAAPPAVSASAARPSIVATEQYYDIDGSSAGALRDQINRLGPKDESGKSRDAVTVWSIEWGYAAASRPEGCVLHDVKVTLNVAVTLPRWKPPATASPGVVRSWQAYLKAVREHEAGHRAIAERNAREVMAALTPLRGPNCDVLSDQATRIAEQIVADGRARNRAYDVETKHGQTQGVVLGP